MDWIGGDWARGYWILAGVALLESLGLPVPAAFALIIAGGAAAHGAIHLRSAFLCGFAGVFLGDIVMYAMGRLTGWWLLGVLCRLSFNPEACILRSADAFYKRGRVLLVFSKFVPGINTLVPPMAGSMRMKIFHFLRLDFLGAVLYAGGYLLVGYLFSDAIDALAKGYHTFDRIVLGFLAAAAVAYLLARFIIWMRARPLRWAPTVEPDVAFEELSRGAAVVYDVRSHGYYDSKVRRIPGSSRLDPNAFSQWVDQLPRGRHIYLYCTCVREATSARVALMLLERGIPCTVIRGGLRLWKKMGLPLEPVPAEELEPLPLFG